MKRQIHDWFELSYASYLVLPRSVLQSLPEEIQERLVAALDEVDDYVANRGFTWPPDNTVSEVRLRDTAGRFVFDPFRDYQRGRRKVLFEIANL